MTLEQLAPNDIILALREQLTPWATQAHAQLSIANDPFEVLELLGQNPPGIRVILHWEGDADATGQPMAGIVTNTIAAIISGNRGLRVWQGENLHSPYGDQPAFLARLSELRAMIRAVRFPPEITDETLLYQGTEPETTPEGLPLDAYRLRFSLTTSLPWIPTTP